MSPGVAKLEGIYGIRFENVPLVELMHLIFTSIPGESYRRRLRSSLCSCDVFRALINSLARLFCAGARGRGLNCDDSL